MREDLAVRVLEMLLNGESKSIEKIDNSLEAKTHCMVGKYCVIRTYSAGVHVGLVESVNGTEVILKDSRRIYYWKGAFTLSELSQNGVGNDSKIAISVPSLVLTEAIEIIPCSKKAENQLKGYSNYEV